MKLEKAIEILSQQLYLPKTAYNYDLADAIKLGIEALDRLQDQRLSFRPINLDLLPSETED